MTDDSKMPSVVDRPHAPVLYFEGAPTFAHLNGLIHVTLTAGLQTPEADGKGVKTEQVVMGYLRTNIAGAQLLRDSLDQALLLARPAETTTKN